MGKATIKTALKRAAVAAGFLMAWYSYSEYLFSKEIGAVQKCINQMTAAAGNYWLGEYSISSNAYGVYFRPCVAEIYGVYEQQTYIVMDRGIYMLWSSAEPLYVRIIKLPSYVIAEF